MIAVRRTAALVVLPLVAAGGLAASASPASAAGPSTYYVAASATCSDTGPGTSASPFCTLQHAADLVGPGDTVLLRGNAAAGLAPAVLRRSGTTAAPVTVAKAPDSRYPVFLRAATDVPVLVLDGVHDVVVRDLYLDEQRNQPAVSVRGSQRVTLEALDVSLNYVARTTTAPPSPGVEVDGASSEVSLTRSRLWGVVTGTAVAARAGARRVALASNLLRALRGPAVSLDGVVDAVVTNNSVFDVTCAAGIEVTGGTSAIVENNVVDAALPKTMACAAGSAAALAVDAASAPHVTADYNAVQAGDRASEYVWAGRPYASVAAFSAATRQGRHDLEQAKPWPPRNPDEKSPLVDSADDHAPGLTDRDLAGYSRVDDPLVPDTGAGTRHADRGAYERQDVLGLASSVTPREGVAPLTVTVKVTSKATSAWGQPIGFTSDFGDGTDGVPLTAGVAATHAYGTAGRYTQVTRAQVGEVREKLTRTITVGTPAPPTVTLAPATVPPGVEVPPATTVLTASAGADAWEVDSCSVDFGDGSGIALPDGDNSLCTGKDTIRHQYDRPGTYTLVMHVRDVLGRDGQARLTVTVGDAYLPVGPAPVRVYAKRVPAHGTVTLPAKDLRADGGDDAALLDVTVTAAQRAGAVAVVPRGRSATGRSNVRFTAGRPATGLVRAVPSGGRVSLVNASAGAITLTVDVVGVVNHEVVGQAYVPLPATAVLDTRAGVGAPKAPLGSRRELALRLAGVPGDATSVALDVSASRATAAGALAVHMYGTARPRTPQLVWTKGQPAANLVVVPVRSGRVLLGATGAGTVDVAATVVGYYRGAGRGSFFVPTAPQRLVDTAAGVGVRRGARLQPGQALRVQLAGRSGRPATGITAADLTVTASGGRAGSVVTFASDGTAASAPSVAFGPGAPGSRLLTVPTGADGAVVLVNQGPVPVDLVVDLDGYYVVGPGA